MQGHGNTQDSRTYAQVHLAQRNLMYKSHASMRDEWQYAVYSGALLKISGGTHAGSTA